MGDRIARMDGEENGKKGEAALLDLLLGAEMQRIRARPAPFSGRLPTDFMQADTFACPTEAAVSRR